MTWRGSAVLALLLAIGTGGGFAASLAAGSQPTATGVPAPVAASPSYPIDPEPEYVADPRHPALPVDLTLGRGRLGTKPFRYVFPVPAGWEAVPQQAGTVKWRDPETPPAWTYVLRVELVGGDNLTVARTLQERIEALDEEEQDLEVLARTADTLTYSYVYDDHLRVGVLRWLRPTGSPHAEVEVAIEGRQRDLLGMQDLMAEIGAGIRRG